MSDDITQYQIITLESGEQIITSVNPFITVQIVSPEDQEVDRTTVALTAEQFDSISEAAETNDIDSATIEANKVNTTENMPDTPNTEMETA